MLLSRVLLIAATNIFNEYLTKRMFYEREHIHMLVTINYTLLAIYG